jgi:hypothetical protein
MSLEPSFSNTRRFAALRMRLILDKQDEIVELETELSKIDKQGVNNAALASRRRDVELGGKGLPDSKRRREILGMLENKVAEYGLFAPPQRPVIFIVG